MARLWWGYGDERGVGGRCSPHYPENSEEPKASPFARDTVGAIQSNPGQACATQAQN